ncbi:cupin domain-containing protein [Azospirillum endophyticum]
MPDALSDILLAMRVESATPVRFESHGGYRMRFPGFRHLKFGALLAGGMTLRPGTGPEMRLAAGDCYLLTDGQPYDSGTADGPAIDGEAYFAAHRGADGVVRYGEGAPDKITIGGRFTLDETGAAWLRLALPPAIHIPAAAPSAAALRSTLLLLTQEAGASAAGEDLVVARLADILLVQALRAYLAAPGGERPNWLAGLADPRLARALRAFHARIGEDWSLTRLASEAGMSRSSFADVFRRRTGLTPMSYVARWRLFRIRAALQQSDRPIATIAEDNGWRSRTSCARAFREVFGISPRDVRQG